MPATIIRLGFRGGGGGGRSSLNSQRALSWLSVYGPMFLDITLVKRNFIELPKKTYLLKEAGFHHLCRAISLLLGYDLKAFY